MALDLSNKYYVRRKSTDAWEDITVKFDGVKVLSLTGMNDLGDAQNVFTQQWIDSSTEDMMITTQTMEDKDVIIRTNVDLDLSFIISRKYTSSEIDEQYVYDNMVKWMCTDGDFYIKSAYVDKQAHVVCLKSVKPATIKLKRGVGSYIMGTIPLHCISTPTT